MSPIRDVSNLVSIRDVSNPARNAALRNRAPRRRWDDRRHLNPTILGVRCSTPLGEVSFFPRPLVGQHPRLAGVTFVHIRLEGAERLRLIAHSAKNSRAGGTGRQGFGIFATLPVRQAGGTARHAMGVTGAQSVPLLAFPRGKRTTFGKSGCDQRGRFSCLGRRRGGRSFTLRTLPLVARGSSFAVVPRQTATEPTCTCAACCLG